MSRIICALTLVVFIFSCKQEKIPVDILSQQRMKDIVWDLLRADEFLLNYAAKDSNFKKKEQSLQLYQQVYTIHKTNRDQFEKSVTFYKVHPDLFKVVLDSLEKMKNRVMENQYKNNPADTAKKRLRLSAPQ